MALAPFPRGVGDGPLRGARLSRQAPAQGMPTKSQVLPGTGATAVPHDELRSALSDAKCHVRYLGQRGREAVFREPLSISVVLAGIGFGGPRTPQTSGGVATRN